jgi:hypothetical protein
MHKAITAIGTLLGKKKDEPFDSHLDEVALAISKVSPAALDEFLLLTPTERMKYISELIKKLKVLKEKISAKKKATHK